MRRTWIWLAAPWILLACEEPPPAEEPAEEPVAVEPALTVYVGSHPLEYFAERIGGGHAEAAFPIPPQTDPSTWSPDPEVVLAYQEADLILLNGAEYEGWTATATLPAARVVDTSAGFEEEVIYVENAITHTHGPEGEHTHGEAASETWLDLALALRQAEAVRDALAAAAPDHAEHFHDAFQALADELRILDRALASALADAEERILLAATPAYHYLSRRYGPEVLHFRFDPSDPLNHDFWHEVEHGLEHGADRLMLWEFEPPDEVRERLAEMGIEPVLFDPAGAKPGTGDFLQVMEANISRLEAALDGEDAG